MARNVCGKRKSRASEWPWCRRTTCLASRSKACTQSPSLGWTRRLHRRLDTHRLDGVVSDLQYFELITFEFEHGACVGKRLEPFKQQSIERLRPVCRQLPLQCTVQRA